MFQFMRKSDRDRDRDKKAGKVDGKMEKVGFGKKVKDKLSPEDLHRLDEIRRSFKLGKGKKEKQKLPSGIIADYSENFMQPPTTPSSLQRSPGSKEQDGMPSITHSDSSESSLSITSMTNVDGGSSSAKSTMSRGGPAKPPRASTKSPPPVPPRQSSSSRYSGDYGSADLSHPGRSPSRPPTSASSSSFTPSYVTPPQSPSHNALSHAKFYPEPELDFSDQLLPSIASKAGCCRTIIVERQPSGDFGFSIRRSSVTVKSGAQDSILYVEPTQGSVTRDYSQHFLLPGDRLIAVNSVSVESKTRDDVINLIKSSQQSITLKVLSNMHWMENISDIEYEPVSKL
ncbi:Unconventional myosin-XVIIIa [Orchesella cincta]|uniref:Unconventional myosin-XVIIIa n=1 Tax=Orchesella cincta TaxID=48709 RepID=A0A1D2N5D1_ORCCI|nr:Unconventional myosin-XVIIIa [Orchesella cincta]